MTAATSAPPVSTPPVSTPPASTPSVRSWRWLRAVIPFVALALLWTGTAVARSFQEPDLRDAGTLSPTGTGDHGSSQLAESLRARGITVDQVTSIKAARGAIAESPSTVFIPTPDFLPAGYLYDNVVLAGARRVVLVAPGPRGLGNGMVPVSIGRSWWVTHTAAPNCSVPAFAAAGPAAVEKRHYQAYPGQARRTFDCYQGSVVGYRVENAEVIYVAASDPFRNDRINEVGNGALAEALLSTNSRVVWLDLHTPESAADLDLPKIRLPDYNRDEQERGGNGSSTIDAFPSWLWAGLLLAALVAFLLALARARRLGPPVAEPLPVVVPAIEVVTGRGRLYDRADARGPTLDALRSAAISRMAKVLNPYGASGSEAELARGASGAEALVRQAAAQAGLSEESVRDTLYDAEPKTNAQLADLVSRLDALTAAVLARPDAPRRDGDPTVRPAIPATSTSDTSDPVDPPLPPQPPQGADS